MTVEEGVFQPFNFQRRHCSKCGRPLAWSMNYRRQKEQEEQLCRSCQARENQKKGIEARKKRR